jgi:predicted anti-sigma-YlaC factor YlaD
MTSCNEIRSLMADWLDDELTPVLKTRVDEHLAGCRECRGAFSTMQGLDANLALLGSAADQIAGSAPAGVRRLRYWQRSWIRAAAVVLLIAGGSYFARIRLATIKKTGVGEPASQQYAGDVPLAMNESAVLEGDCRAVGRTVVALATANPRVRIVWLYEDAGTGVGSTNSSGGPRPRPQS